MPLRLELAVDTPLPIELTGVTPDRLAEQSLLEIQRQQVLCGNRRVALADLFRVDGDPNDGRMVLAGALAQVHSIGAGGMAAGVIEVHGTAGRHLGAGLRGGEVHVFGDVGDFAGCHQAGGRIHVRGNVGDHCAAAYAGATRGMIGGVMLIDGHAGAELGQRMRRGLVACRGEVGPLAGSEMLAGTLFLGGLAAWGIGAEMRRGTILCAIRPPLGTGFHFACRFRPTVLPLVLASLARHGFSVDDALFSADVDLYHGDMLSLGRGEVLVADG